MTFSWNISLGHIVTFISGLCAIIGVYVAFTQQLSNVDIRTHDYLAVRDIVLTDDAKIGALQVTLSTQVAAEAQISATLSTIREDIASIKATLAAQGRNSP